MTIHPKFYRKILFLEYFYFEVKTHILQHLGTAFLPRRPFERRSPSSFGQGPIFHLAVPSSSSLPCFIVGSVAHFFKIPF